MTLPASSTLIPCQTCGREWEKSDTATSHWFESASYSIGSFASPAMISSAGEDITFCPSCYTRGLASLDDATAKGDRIISDELPPGSGDATVVHIPEKKVF